MHIRPEREVGHPNRPTFDLTSEKTWDNDEPQGAPDPRVIPCPFVGKVDPPGREKEPRVTCVHNIELAWNTARAAMGLSPMSFEGEGANVA